MNIDTKVSGLRSQGEVMFFALSAVMDREQAENATIIAQKLILEALIKEHEHYKATTYSLMESRIGKGTHSAIDKAYEIGVRSALKLRLERHRDEIEKYNEQLQLLKFL